MNRCTHTCRESRDCTCTQRQRIDGAKVAVGIWLAVVWAVCTALAKWLGAPIQFL